MAWALLSFILLHYCAGISSQPTVTQPASESVSPGQTIPISCSKSSGSWDSRFWWIRQKPGAAPHFVHCNGCSRGEGIPDRFTASASGNTGQLTITNAQPEDEADYYCVSFYNTANTWVFGGGTQLTVTGQNPVHPSVFLFPPSQEEIKTKSKATLVCLMDEFHPGVIQVEWKADGTTISSGVETTKPLKQGNKYVASSYLTLSESDWKSHNKYACKVTHESKTIEKEVNRSECS
ncbi:immunoglobulin lambda-1 light chain-like isoform X14 [Sceloporus undulatus]|uniref:immunoglobulin lambda-1 light chain-like isoform X14 n=1 Tax=Sceloporus undulatus TaxID=8520 RepID=UPI001C4C38CD|nr:immunoglobulin lambda-1 light chain-like isoform X14 [Sceloporus undulatus]